MGRVTEAQLTAACPQCGSTAQVHSIQELADMARMRLNQIQQGTGQPGGGQQPGWGGQPQSGPVPGWGAEPQAGPVQGSGGWAGGGPVSAGSVFRDAARGDDLTGLAMGVAGRFIGQAIGRRVQRAVTERVVPAVTAKGEAVIQQQIAVAEKYPGLRACMADKVIFLAGGSRVVPMSEVNLGAITVDQADQLVARLQS
jgi:hypothetical protein